MCNNKNYYVIFENILKETSFLFILLVEHVTVNAHVLK